jgi:hypothetical protein
MREFKGKGFLWVYKIRPEVNKLSGLSLVQLIRTGEFTAIEAQWEYAVFRVWRNWDMYSGEFQVGHSPKRYFPRFENFNMHMAGKTVDMWLQDGKWYDGSLPSVEEHPEVGFQDEYDSLNGSR